MLCGKVGVVAAAAGSAARLLLLLRRVEPGSLDAYFLLCPLHLIVLIRMVGGREREAVKTKNKAKRVNIVRPRHHAHAHDLCGLCTRYHLVDSRER